MTITYSLHVSKARLGGFAKLLLRWRGSIYKLLYREMLIFIGIYYVLLALYRLVLDEPGRVVFEKLSRYCDAFTDLIPLSFVLGFYVSIVVGRWWQQYMSIPWPDKTCMLISAYINGADERGRIIRRTLSRYLSLMSALTFQAISPAVKKRFPTIDHLIEAGLMTKEENKAYEEINMTHGKWWVPAQWFTSLTTRARREGRIKDDILLKDLLAEMHVFRGNCGLLFSYDWISIPLVYTQVVTLAIYTYFSATLMGRQYLNPEKGYPGHEINLYVPVFTLLQFFFYMGWLKVAEQLINPFGEDDDDFELNWCLDRNLQFSYNVVDVMHERHPRLIKDIFWDDTAPQLPYTKSSYNLRSQPHLGSAMNLDVNLDESEFITMETIMEEDRDENNYCSPPRSPTFDSHMIPSFDSFSVPPFLLNTDIPSRRISIASIEADAVSLSKPRIPDFPGSKLVNMIIGSNHDLSHSRHSVSDAQCASPLILRSPCSRKKLQSYSEASPLVAGTDDKQDLDEPSMFIDIGQDGGIAIPMEPVMFLEKPSEYCIMKIPNLSVVDEESSRSSRGSSPVNEQGQIALQIDMSYKSPELPSSDIYEPNSSQESLLTSSSDSQSTVDSFSDLLRHQN